MKRLLVLFPIIVLTCNCTSVSAGELMTPGALSSLGLAQAWTRPVHVPAGAQSIRDQQLFVHEKAPHEYVIITAPKPAPPADPATAVPPDAATPDATAPATPAEPETIVLARIPVDRIGINGTPIGRAEAERLASNEIRRLKRRGVDAEMKVITSPRVNLYTIGSDGLLECRNAETGEPIWIQRVGRPSFPFSDLGVDEQYITVVNGGNLIQVDAENGEILREVRAEGAPAFGAVNSGGFAVVPLIGGGIESYSLHVPRPNEPEHVPVRMRVRGTTLAMPAKAPNSSSIAWGTSAGFVYVASLSGSRGPELRFSHPREMRRKPNKTFMGQASITGITSGRIAAASGDRFFYGTDQGQVCALRARGTGEVLWAIALAEPFYKRPLVFEEQVLICSSYGNLFSLSVENGLQTWNGSVPNIGELLGVLDQRLYATTMSGGLVVLDVKTGKKLATFNDIHPQHFIVNDLTDRLYLVSNDGDVQCIRPEGANLPTLVAHTEPKKTVKTATPETDPTQAPAQPVGNDPFGAGQKDPFGAGGGNNDPFGGGGGGNADPFGGGGNADPFGGGGAGGDGGMADPFGGSPF